ncbi:myb-related transcription factor, partner of profilin-like [Anneissia japonica]|uniref:myb-related transcription factor, partner of profilin-like n=1 Tax=Anneissia japonica TaxID=1529436 RepID=UPI0014255BE9|nr:myb-related transcription factor, partner of profilin-like [Anneissia japonica]
MEPSKSKRNTHFSANEITAIVGGVSRRKSIINGSLCGSTVTCSQKKKRAWEEVADEVWAVGGSVRTVEEIKKKWSNIKVESKKQGALHRHESNKTGGAPAALDDECQKILATIGDAAIYGIKGGLEGTINCEGKV